MHGHVFVMLKVYITFSILSVIEKLPPLKFRHFEKYKISSKHCKLFQDPGQQQIDLETFNSSPNPETMVHVQHVQFVIFIFF